MASHSPLNISETVRDRNLVWFQRTTNRKWPMGIEWSRDRWRHVTSNGQVVTPIRLEPNISKTAGDAIYPQSLITR